MTHYPDDSIPDYELDRGFEAASHLLENKYGEIPDPDWIGQEIVEDRAQARIESRDDDQYWDGEDETLRELLQAHDIEA